MVKKLIIFFLLCLGIVSNPLLSQEGVPITNRSTTIQLIDGQQYYFHAVLQGQTLYSIARAYGVSQEDILRENPDIRDELRFDQIIRIPVAADTDRTDQTGTADTDVILPEKSGSDPTQTRVAEVTDSGDQYLIYNVLPGDTRYGISRKFGISIDTLDALNPGIEDGLNAGAQVRVPADASTAAIVPFVEGGSYITISRPAKPQALPGIDDYCYNPELKDEYRVALLIPFYLEELISEVDSLLDDEGEIRPEYILENLLGDSLRMADLQNNRLKNIGPDHTSFTFINYYHGVLLAMDSIRQQGVNIRLFVKDVCQDVRKAHRVTDDPGFSNTDLIIGPFHRQSLDYIADYGRRHDILVVSPLLPDKRQLRSFPNLLKVTPSLETMLEGVARYISGTYPQQNIIIVHNQQPGAAPIIGTFRDELLAELAMSNHVYDSLNLLRVNGFYLNETYIGGRRTNVTVMPDTVSVMVPVSGIAENTIRVPKPYNVHELIFRYEGMQGLKKMLRKDRQNILITLISGEPFLSDYLRQLHGFRHDYDISVFGIPEWRDYASIEIDYLQNLRVHFFVPDYYNYQDPHIRDLVLRYRKMFRMEPSDEALKAAQTAYFFFSALAEYGPDFQKCMPLLNYHSIENPFHFHRPFGTDAGWENKNFHIYRIDNYRRVDMQRPLIISEGL
jgi:LysM repeat protein